MIDRDLHSNYLFKDCRKAEKNPRPTAISRVLYIQTKIYTKLRKSQKYTEDSEMLKSLRNVHKNSSVPKSSSKSAEKVIKNEVITDRLTSPFGQRCV